MFKRITALIMCGLLCAAVGCSKTPDRLSVDKGDEPSSATQQTVSEPEYYVNPLTGERDIDEQTAKKRPVAITINNLSQAQTVQTGIGEADIVYETEVEGGITRLLAVYQDTTAIEKIGTVRSARYAFIDLALGHDAIYVHHGEDYLYAKSHLKDVDHFTVSELAGGARISNGLAREHTLYAYGDGLWSALSKAGFELERKRTENWQSFGDPSDIITFEGKASSITVPFSASYKSIFKYDSVAGRYVRHFNAVERKDYVTGKPTYFKNVVVLMTAISNYSDGYHRNVSLNNGTGYYFTNGTYTPINWSKGSAKNKLSFTLTDGTPLTLNVGNTWVCIADNITSKPILE